MRTLKSLLFLGVVSTLITGCANMRPQRGGGADTRQGKFSATMTQSENPQGPSTQTVEHSVEIEPGIPLAPDAPVSYVLIPATGSSNVVAIPSHVRETTKTTTTLGAAQKDTARELAAKLKATAPAFYVGIACLLGAGALFYFGWTTPAMIAAAVGLGLMLFSQLVATHSVLLLVLAVGGLAIVFVFRAYEKGQLDHILAHGHAVTPAPVATTTAKPQA